MLAGRPRRVAKPSEQPMAWYGNMYASLGGGDAGSCCSGSADVRESRRCCWRGSRLSGRDGVATAAPAFSRPLPRAPPPRSRHHGPVGAGGVRHLNVMSRRWNSEP
jgi:hypothetical protein